MNFDLPSAGAISSGLIWKNHQLQTQNAERSSAFRTISEKILHYYYLLCQY